MRDVVIVGAGPGGTSAAMALAGSGLDVLVLDRLDGDRHDTYHRICGEAVSDRMFSRLGWRPSEVRARVDSIRISMPGGAVIDIPASGCILDRPTMLREMRERCDAEFAKASVASVSEADGSYVLTMTDGSRISCRYLIGADGAHSVVRRDVFGLGPTARMPIVNCIAEGDGGTVLDFTVGQGIVAGYTWRFPSAPGLVSVGFPAGFRDPREVDGLVSWHARDLPYGTIRDCVRGRCLLVGDSACMANPMCYGGIGIAMVAGREAAEAVIAGRPQRYAGWVSRTPLLSRRFMDAHESFAGWTAEDIADAMGPFRGGFSLPRGMYACLRRPRWAGVYLATFFALHLGWRYLFMIRILMIPNLKYCETPDIHS